MVPIKVVAGEKAYKKIKQEGGLDVNQIKGVSAAAGGPKWFTIYGLMRYILNDVIHPLDHQVSLIGASVGSWQMTAGATTNPGRAIDALREEYCEHIYSEKPDAKEVSDACLQIVRSVIGEDLDFVLSNQKRSLHVITTRLKGTKRIRNMAYQTAMLGLGAVGNTLGRSKMELAFSRTVFSNSEKLPYDVFGDVIKTSHHSLDQHNIEPALQSSGAIPYVMNGVYDIPGAKSGAYWDGGITDYHMSLPYTINSGFVLLPHFSDKVYAGWFDKKLPWGRYASTENMQNVVLIHPTEEYIDSLPKQRISSMQDFYDYSTNQEDRIKYWKEICQRSLEMGTYLKDCIATGSIADVVEPYQ